MLNNSKVIQFVNRLASDAELRAEMENDFDGTLNRFELPLTDRERESLRASWSYIREVAPVPLEARVAACDACGDDSCAEGELCGADSC